MQRDADYVVRPAQVGDLPAMVALESLVHPHPWSYATFLLEFSRQDSLIYVAEARDAGGYSLAGYACGWLVADEIQVHNVAVDPQARGLGIGGTLLQALLAAGPKRRAGSAVLEVRMANLPALQLYRKHGFSVVGWRPGYYEHPMDDACLMSRKI